ncbi:MAG: glycosyltransferase family 4 protein, partial [bacterium]|nr:glycosyltransferase family 4 protein [bacterium]
RLLWQKGLGEYLKAISLLKPKYQDVSFEIAGEFDLIHPDAVSEDVIRDMENRGEGRYLGYLTNLDEVYPSVDLIVLPSYREGVPRVVLEAAACGVATVGADVPGTREAIRDGETGMLVPVKDVEALAAAIASLLDDREKLKLLGANARKMIVQQFDIREITEKQITVYTDLGLR